MNPFLTMLVPPLFARVGIAGTAILGVPGEVGEAQS
jgi:hypothetical protein